jgi:hypothetical protein
MSGILPAPAASGEPKQMPVWIKKLSCIVLVIVICNLT